MLPTSFNPRSHTGSDRSAHKICSKPVAFNPRSHTGSDRVTCAGKRVVKAFNPRSHTGSDLKCGAYNAWQELSIHAPTRGATLICWWFFFVTGDFQSTLPHGERHCGVVWLVTSPVLSIHAPTRGATQQHYPAFSKASLSIHAPTRGATLRGEGSRKHGNFQSTLPHGERPDVKPGINITNYLSIHAPTRGATFTIPFSPVTKNFQSTLPHGERLRSATSCHSIPSFNPRSHTGSDGHKPARYGFGVAFNPRSHTGSDPCCFTIVLTSELSIHAPTRGATV